MTDRQSRLPSEARALVTGASTGIGRELARVFAQHGHPLVLVARNGPRLHQLADELREQYKVAVDVLIKDLSLATTASELFQELNQKSLSINILVNNAGLDVYGDFVDTDWAEELRLLQVNLLTLTQLTKLLLKDMRAQGYGRILNLGSTGSFIPSPLNAVYSATKAYVLSFSEAVAEELRGSGVTITVLCPGVTRSEFHQRAGMERIRLLRFGVMEAGVVAEAGYQALMAGRRVVVPGWINQIQVLAARLLPSSVMTRIAKVMNTYRIRTVRHLCKRNSLSRWMLKFTTACNRLLGGDTSASSSKTLSALM